VMCSPSKMETAGYMHKSFLTGLNEFVQFMAVPAVGACSRACPVDMNILENLFLFRRLRYDG